VRFRLADVFLPSPQELHAAFREEEALEGVVVDFSDSGSWTNAFAIIEVILKETIVVQVDKLEASTNADVANDRVAQAAEPKWKGPAKQN